MGRKRKEEEQDTTRSPEDDLEDEEEVEDDPDSDDSAANDDDEEVSPDSDDDSDDDEGLDPERLLRTVRNQRKVEKSQKQRIRELERENKQFKRSKQSKDEQLTGDLEERDSRITELEGENQSLRQGVQRSNFLEHAVAAGFTARQARYLYKDRDELGIDVEFDDENRVQTSREAIRKAAKKLDPEMYATGSADGGTREKRGQRESSTGGMNDMIRGAAGR